MGDGGESVETFLVELVGDARPLLQAIDAAMTESQDILVSSAEEMESRFVETLTKAFAADLEPAMRDVLEQATANAIIGGTESLEQEIGQAAGRTAETLTALVGALEEVNTEGLTFSETTGPKTEARMRDIAKATEVVTEKIAELKVAFQKDIEEGLGVLVEKFEEAGIKMDPELTERMFKVVVATREVSTSTMIFQQNLEQLIPILINQAKAEEEVAAKTEEAAKAEDQAAEAATRQAEATKTATSARKESEAAAKAQARSFKSLASVLLRGIGAFTLVRQAIRAVTQFLKESVDAYLQTASANDELANALRLSDEEMGRTKAGVGAIIIEFIAFKNEIELTATRLAFVFADALAKAADSLTIFEAKLINFLNRAGARIDFFLARTQDGFTGTFEEFLEGVDIRADELLESVTREVEEGAEARRQRVQDAFENFIPEPLKSAFEKAQREIERASTQLERRLSDIARNLQRRLADITRDVNRRRSDLELELSRDLQDIDREAARDRADIQEEARLEEIREVEDHQDRLRELENKFLLDLEDAVRERDARRVLLLIRRFNLEKQKSETDFSKRQRRRKEDLALELQELEQQRQQKRADLFRDHEQELEDLRLQAERRRMDARENAARQRADARMGFTRRLTDLGAALAAEFKLTRDQIIALRQMLTDMYGPQGFVVTLIRAASAQIAGISLGPAINPFAGTGMTSVGSGINAFAGTGRTSTPFRFQRGGEFVATSPTDLRVGEGRPEAISITPLSSGGAASGIGGGSREGRMELEITIEEGLRAEIKDEAMEGLADVVTNITKTQSRQRR